MKRPRISRLRLGSSQIEALIGSEATLQRRCGLLVTGTLEAIRRSEDTAVVVAIFNGVEIPANELDYLEVTL